MSQQKTVRPIKMMGKSEHNLPLRALCAEAHAPMDEQSNESIKVFSVARGRRPPWRKLALPTSSSRCVVVLATLSIALTNNQGM